MLKRKELEDEKNKKKNKDKKPKRNRRGARRDSMSGSEDNEGAEEEPY